MRIRDWSSDVCSSDLIIMPAKRLRRSTPKAAMMPSVIGTRQATRAVDDDTRKAMTKPTTIRPTTTWRVSVPTRERIVSEISLYSPDEVIPPGTYTAAANSERPVNAKPTKAQQRHQTHRHDNKRDDRE